jgi:hypothetical protein
MPPDAFLRRQIRIERLRDGSPERVEDARILLLPGGALELTIEALWTPARELGDLVDAEGVQIAFDGWTYRPEVSKPARFFLVLPATPLKTTAS